MTCLDVRACHQQTARKEGAYRPLLIFRYYFLCSSCRVAFCCAARSTLLPGTTALDNGRPVSTGSRKDDLI